MRDGFVQVAALTPAIRVADVDYNVDACLAAVRATSARIIVLPELALTAYTCEDLFWQDALLDAAEAGLARFARETADIGALICVGVPVRVAAKLYNCAAVLNRGTLIGLVPKHAIPTYNEFYEIRHFCPGPHDVMSIEFAGQHVPFGMQQLFACRDMPELVVGFEICEDLWVPNPPSTGLAQAGATLICNLSASNELVGKASYRRSLVSATSARLICAYVYASAGWGESTQDLVFGGHDLICENGHLLKEDGPLVDAPCAGSGTSAVIDVQLLAADRRRMSTFVVDPAASGYKVIPFSLTPEQTSLMQRFIDPHPFVPSDKILRAQHCETILNIQARGLAQRLAHTHSQRVVIGVSGGLDSTLALLVCARAFDLFNLPRSGILALTMPGFGTTKRTHSNAADLSKALGCELREISIEASVRQHFADIGHDEADHSVTYENAQARERTQILMDVANQEGGLVVGTGDLSELALGWATYNADHMSMYGVNASVPKTLVRHLVRYVADEAARDEQAHERALGAPSLAGVLYDVLDTPVSPELLPAQGDGTISQRTEDLVGPYELHDFFLYNMLRCGFSPSKVYRLACAAFAPERQDAKESDVDDFELIDVIHGAIDKRYDDTAVGSYDVATILTWLKTFYRRFFSQQFKRSCLPDGPKVGSVAISPRGDLRMPSDASAALWLRELEAL